MPSHAPGFGSLFPQSGMIGRAGLDGRGVGAQAKSPFPGTWLSSSLMPSGLLEQQQIISRRPLVFARRADDFRPERGDEPVQHIHVGALAGAEAKVMQANPFL